MLGERSDQRGLWEADRLYLDHVGPGTFYGLPASLRGRLFRDSRIPVVCGFQREGSGGQRLVRPPEASQAVGGDCGRLGPTAGVGPAGSGRAACR